MKVVGKTHIGMQRVSNQDSFFIGEDLFMIADGMGGHKAGEVASEQAIKLMQKALEHEKPDVNILEKAIKDINLSIYLMQKNDEKLSGMGTTLSAMWKKKNKVLIGHVGDSRVYLLREGKLLQITEDHSVVAEMMRKGIISSEQAEKHPFRNVVTRAIGSSEGIQIDTIEMERKLKDRWLICSDGLTSMLGDAKISLILQENLIEDAVDKLVEKALLAGGKDNISVIVLEEEEIC